MPSDGVLPGGTRCITAHTGPTPGGRPRRAITCELGFVWAVQPKPKPGGHVGGTRYPPTQDKQTESVLETAATAPSALHSCPSCSGSRGKHIIPMSTSQVEQEAHPQVLCRQLVGTTSPEGDLRWARVRGLH